MFHLAPLFLPQFSTCVFLSSSSRDSGSSPTMPFTCSSTSSTVQRRAVSVENTMCFARSSALLRATACFARSSALLHATLVACHEGTEFASSSRESGCPTPFRRHSRAGVCWVYSERFPFHGPDPRAY